MTTVNELDKYIEKVRSCFPKGFSKHFYNDKTGKDFRKLDEEILNNTILPDFRSEIIASQSENPDFSYRGLAKRFGRPRKAMRELLWDSVPEEEYVKLKRKHNWIRAGVGAFIVIAVLSLSVLGTCVHTSQIEPIREVKTLVIGNGNNIPSSKITEILIDIFEKKGKS